MTDPKILHSGRLGTLSMCTPQLDKIGLSSAQHGQHGCVPVDQSSKAASSGQHICAGPLRLAANALRECAECAEGQEPHDSSGTSHTLLRVSKPLNSSALRASRERHMLLLDARPREMQARERGTCSLLSSHPCQSQPSRHFCRAAARHWRRSCQISDPHSFQNLQGTAGGRAASAPVLPLPLPGPCLQPITHRKCLSIQAQAYNEGLL